MITSIRGCVMNNDLWPWHHISSRSLTFSHDFAIKLVKYVTFCHVCFTAHTVLDWFFLYLAQMITNMRGCVVCKDLWPWPISSGSFSYNFLIKLLRFGTSCCVCPTACRVLEGLFPNLAQMITSMRGCVAYNDLWLWSLSSRTTSHDFAIKLLKYDTSCRVCSTACTLLVEFFPYFAQMITSMGGCVAHLTFDLDLYLQCDIANFMDYIHMWHKYHLWGEDVSHFISWSISQWSRSHGSFQFL